MPSACKVHSRKHSVSDIVYRQLLLLFVMPLFGLLPPDPCESVSDCWQHTPSCLGSTAGRYTVEQAISRMPAHYGLPAEVNAMPSRQPPSRYEAANSVPRTRTLQLLDGQRR